MRGIRAFWVVGPASLLTVLLTFPGCTRVADQLTGVEIRFQSPTDCARSCNNQFAQDLATATRKLGTDLVACKQLPEADRRGCIQAAWSAYEAAVAALNQKRKACIGGCHTQGSGTGG